MIIENDQDYKILQDILLAFKKTTLTNFSGSEAFDFIKNLEYLARCMVAYKKPPEPIKSNVTSITKGKKK